MRINEPKVMLRFVIFAAIFISSESAKTFRLVPNEPKWGIKITSLKTCPGVVPFFDDFNYELVNGTGKINFTLTKPAKSISKIVASITKCRTHCEHFQTWQYSPGCALLEQKNTFWTPLLENFHPPTKCPMKPGFYRSDKANFDTRLLLNLPFLRENSRYRIRLNATVVDNPDVCLDGVVLFEEMKVSRS